ncbi:DUF4892 domain-containing protein [Marinomonas spartinae]|nr:DUF4892 domain-containing protein [Marinomonas spartinae]
MVNFKKVMIACSMLVSSIALADLANIEPYRGAQLVKSGTDDVSLIEVPLGKIRRSGRGWEPESVIRVKGENSYSLYKINRNEPLSSVLAYYKSVMLKGDRRLLFECDGRNCGSSNAWANNFFKQYLLYGADDNQMLMSLQDGLGDYQVLYINQRGAGDIMVWISDISTNATGKADFEVAAQFDVQDIPRIRRFLSDLLPSQHVVGYVSSKAEAGYSALSRGDQFIKQIQLGIGERLQAKVRFINVADMGRTSLGQDRVSFVYILP